MHEYGNQTMQDPTIQIQSTARDYRGVGLVIGGLVALKAMSAELLVLLPKETIRVRSADLRVTDAGIGTDDRLLVPFAGTDVWDRHYEGPCVNFTMDGVGECLIAPATRPAGMDVGAEVKRFFDRCSQDDDFFLYDLDGCLPNGPEQPEDKMVVMRSAPDKDVVDDGDAIIVLGSRLPVADMTWAEMDSDGDGNYYLHVVMSDGRYRRVCAGDFSR